MEWQWPEKVVFRGRTYFYYASLVSLGAAEETREDLKIAGRPSVLMSFRNDRGDVIYLVYSDEE